MLLLLFRSHDHRLPSSPVSPATTLPSGRGTRIHENAGNVRFRNIIGAVFHQYQNIKEGQKHLFAQEVTDFVLSQGRIVERDEAGNWRDAPYHKCKKKTQTLLRDYSLKERRSRMRFDFPPSVSTCGQQQNETILR